MPNMNCRVTVIITKTNVFLQIIQKSGVSNKALKLSKPQNIPFVLGEFKR